MGIFSFSLQEHSWLEATPAPLTSAEADLAQGVLQPGEQPSAAMKFVPVGSLKVATGTGSIEPPDEDEIHSLVTRSTPNLGQEESIATTLKYRNYGEQAADFAQGTMNVMQPDDASKYGDTHHPPPAAQPSPYLGMPIGDNMDRGWVEELAAIDQRKWDARISHWYEDEPDDFGPPRGSVVDVDVGKIRERLGPAESQDQDMPPSKNL